MTKIYLIRHGVTQDNLDKRHQSSSTPLNETGLEQAKKVAEKLKDLKISTIYSSPFVRAMQTAEVIASHHELDIIKVDNLRERSFGDFIGLTRKEVLKIMPDIEEQFKHQGMDWKAPNGESMRELQSRVVKIFKDLANKHGDENIIIISHGATIITLLIHCLKVPIENVFAIRPLGNCEVIEVDWNKGKAELKYE